MKKIYVIGILTAALTIASCGGNSDDNKGTKFAPKEKEMTMSDEEREAKIAEKRQSLIEVDMDSLLASHGVKFSVLPPAVTDNVPRAASDKLGSKMIQIAAKNGISGLCTNPVLAIVTRVDCVDRSMTGTAPQKAIVKYEITMYCGNFITNDIYATATQTITGVGANFEDAAGKAMNELKDTKDIQQMLKTASVRALAWYNAAGNVKNYVDKAVSEKDYGVAMALLSSVPQQSSTFEWAVKRNKEVSDMFFEDKSAEMLGELEDAIAAAGDDYNDEIGAYLAVIPERSKSYARAKKLYDDYVTHLKSVKTDEREKAHIVEMQKMAYEHAEHMEQLEVDKIKAPYEAQATIAKINADERIGIAQADAEKAKNENTGGFLGLGKLWDGTFELANRMFDKLEGKK